MTPQELVAITEKALQISRERFGSEEPFIAAIEEIITNARKAATATGESRGDSVGPVKGD
jgi:hypothetical protein